MPCIVSGLKHAIKVGRPICVRVRHVELQLLLFVWFNPAKPSPFRNHRTVFQYLTVGARVWFNGQTETRTWIVESTGSIFFSMAPICTCFFSVAFAVREVFLCQQDVGWHRKAWHRNAPIGCTKKMLWNKIYRHPSFFRCGCLLQA